MSRETAPIEALKSRLHNLERLHMIETLRQERKGRGIHPMLQDLAEQHEWKKANIICERRWESQY